MYIYVHVPVVDMRESAAQASKVVSQALFGEQVQVGARSGEWVHIATPDAYTGWVKFGDLAAISEPYRQDIEVTRLSAHVYPTNDTEYGPFFTLPYGSKLRVLEQEDARWIRVSLLDGREAFIQKGDVVPEVHKDLISFSKKFLGLPYTWGGRSSFGYDCSGFVQMIYKRIGIQLPRDARQQVLDPRGKVVAMDALAAGDLIFFGRSESDIGHVGMSLGGLTFIHASSRENRPYLRTSELCDLEWSGHAKSWSPYRTARRIQI